MGALFPSFPPNLHRSFITSHHSSECELQHRSIEILGNQGTGRGKLKLTHLKAVNDVVSAATTDPSQAVMITWQTAAGSLGVCPFSASLVRTNTGIDCCLFDFGFGYLVDMCSRCCAFRRRWD